MVEGLLSTGPTPSSLFILSHPLMTVQTKLFWDFSQVKNKGLVLFSACSHAGVVNVMKSATKLLGKK